MNNSIYYFTVQDKTVFIPFRYVYPECAVLIEGEPQLHQLICMVGPCHRNKGCAELIAKRVHYLYSQVFPKAELMVAYFKDAKGSIKAGIFDPDFNEPKLITCNRTAFDKFLKEGVSYEAAMPNDYWMMTRIPGIIPVEALIRE